MVIKVYKNKIEYFNLSSICVNYWYIIKYISFKKFFYCIWFFVDYYIGNVS